MHLYSENLTIINTFKETKAFFFYDYVNSENFLKRIFTKTFFFLFPTTFAIQ